MATLKLGKLYNGGVLVNFDSTAVYDSATKQALSTFIANTNSALANKSRGQVVADITARDALSASNLLVGDIVWVTDASSDSTVTSGAAAYIVSAISGSTITWAKLSEAESLDVSVSWSDVGSKPAAVTGLGVDGTSGNLTFNGVELGGYTGTAVGATLAGATDYTAKLQLVVEDFDPAAA